MSEAERLALQAQPDRELRDGALRRSIMHFTGTVYRNPYWPTWPLLEITQGCTHNRCKFCTMYKDVPFRMSPMEWIEEDLRELAQTDPDATTIQLLSANPLVLPYDKLAPILKMIRRYLPKMEYVYLPEG